MHREEEDACLSLHRGKAGRVLCAVAEDSGVEECRRQSLGCLRHMSWCSRKVPELEGQRSVDVGRVDCGDLHACGGSYLADRWMCQSRGWRAARGGWFLRR